MTQTAARKCFEAAGLRPSDVDVVELHDCFSANELITYEALGLCAEGKNASYFTPFFYLLPGWPPRGQQPETSPSPGSRLSVSNSFNLQFQSLISLQ